MIIKFIFFVTMAAAAADPASDQLCSYRNKTWGPLEYITTSNGAPVDVMQTSLLNDSPLVSNAYFLETQSHFDRQRIPERVVYAKGAGAFGYFEVTHNVTDICKAKLFSKIGKITPTAVRFSQTSSERGEPDTNRDGRGFSVRFLTEEGNFDIVGQNFPICLVKDPIIFPSIFRAFKRNPATNLKDFKMFWDLLTFRPETFFFLMYLFGDNGIPDGYRFMPGYSVHTYQVYNKFGKSSFVRLHFRPKLGLKHLSVEDAKKLAVSDSDYAVRDLYNAIAEGNFPIWTVSVQVLSYEDVKKAKFDVFDITKILPINEYPLRPLGNLVLNKNPNNFFADIEQLAVSPINTVPGILGAPDQMYLARLFSYRDTQLHRLGVNFNKISVNWPLRNVFTYNRDGVPPVGLNGGDGPNYFPNSYHGPIPHTEKNRPTLLRVVHDESFNFEQAASFYTNDMTKAHRTRMVTNIVMSLRHAERHVQQKAIGIFTEIHPDLAYRVEAGLADGC